MRKKKNRDNSNLVKMLKRKRNLKRKKLPKLKRRKKLLKEKVKNRKNGKEGN